jgi:hypothetical protein
MRKQDRIRQQQSQNARPEQQPDTQQPKPTERLKGSASEQPSRPPRQPGKLPLPE